MEDVRGFIHADQRRGRPLSTNRNATRLQRDADLTASDLDREARIGYNDRSFFQNYFASRVHALGFTMAAIIKADGSIVEKIETGNPSEIVRPETAHPISPMRATATSSVSAPTAGGTFVALRYLPSFGDSLSLCRPPDRSLRGGVPAAGTGPWQPL